MVESSTMVDKGYLQDSLDTRRGSLTRAGYHDSEDESGASKAGILVGEEDGEQDSVALLLPARASLMERCAGDGSYQRALSGPA